MNKYEIMVVFTRSEIPSAILNDDRNARYGHRGSDSGDVTVKEEELPALNTGGKYSIHTVRWLLRGI